MNIRNAILCAISFLFGVGIASIAGEIRHGEASQTAAMLSEASRIREIGRLLCSSNYPIDLGHTHDKYFQSLLLDHRLADLVIEDPKDRVELFRSQTEASLDPTWRMKVELASRVRPFGLSSDARVLLLETVSDKGSKPVLISSMPIHGAWLVLDANGSVDVYRRKAR